MEKFSSGTLKNVSEDVIEELFEKDYIRRTIIDLMRNIGDMVHLFHFHQKCLISCLI